MLNDTLQLTEMLSCNRAISVSTAEKK